MKTFSKYFKILNFDFLQKKKSDGVADDIFSFGQKMNIVGSFEALNSTD